MPDAELSARAAAGELRNESVLLAQVRRMLKDERARRLATEFGGNWLDFRRFDEHNAVDRERFPEFSNELRDAMFQEPIRFISDVVRNDRSVLDMLYGNHTFANPVLAKHYGISTVSGPADQWVRIDNARQYERGGLLPMAAFLTQNAPGLRTSPVKRGYWVARRVLGEVIPPPPPTVPELPKDEAKLDLPLREMLAKHRDNPSCSSLPCALRFVRADVRRLRTGRRNAIERPGRTPCRRAGDVSRRKPGGGARRPAELYPGEPRKRLSGQP